MIENQFRHEALLYAGEADFLRGTMAFIRRGLVQEEAVLVVESAPKIAALRRELGEDASLVHFAAVAQVGATPARIIPAWRDFVSEHGRDGKGLRGIGEPIWAGRTAGELVGCQRHESLLNVAFATGSAWWLLCPYDIENLDPTVIEEAKRSHEYVSQTGEAALRTAYRGLEASGAPFDAPLPKPHTGVRRLVFGRDDLSAVRRVVGEAAAQAGLGATRTGEFVIAANEVATNSLLHGGEGGTLQVWTETDKLLCEVADKGRYSHALADRCRPAPDPAAPRGLWLANQLCELVQIRTLPEGTVVRLHMRLDPRHHLRVMGDLERRATTSAN